MDFKEIIGKKTKVIILGNTRCGKSNIMLRYNENKFFHDHISTIGVDFVSKNNIDLPCGVKSHIQIWQLAGGYKFQEIAVQYYKNCQGFLFVYDVTDRHSFDMIDYWVEKVLKSECSDSIGVLVANKVDLLQQRVISVQEGIKKSKKIGKYHQVSAKAGQGIQELFLSILSSIICKQKSLRSQNQDYSNFQKKQQQHQSQ